MNIGIGNDIVSIDRFKAILQRRRALFLSRFLNPNEMPLVLKSHILNHKNYFNVFNHDFNLYKKALSQLDILDLKIESVAGLWSAKESIAKAIGCGIGRELGFYDMQIYKDEFNAPKVKLLNNKNILLKISNIEISISHDGGFAIASCIAIKE